MSNGRSNVPTHHHPLPLMNKGVSREHVLHSTTASGTAPEPGDFHQLLDAPVVVVLVGRVVVVVRGVVVGGWWWWGEGWWWEGGRRRWWEEGVATSTRTSRSNTTTTTTQPHRPAPELPHPRVVPSRFEINKVIKSLSSS